MRLSLSSIPVGAMALPIELDCDLADWLPARRRQVVLLVAGANVRIVTTDGVLLRDLTLDPNQGY
jgi:hypothetical protein